MLCRKKYVASVLQRICAVKEHSFNFVVYPFYVFYSSMRYFEIYKNDFIQSLLGGCRDFFYFTVASVPPVASVPLKFCFYIIFKDFDELVTSIHFQMLQCMGLLSSIVILEQEHVKSERES